MKKISFDEIIEVVNDKSRRKNGVVLYTNTIYKNRQPYKNLSDVVLPPLMKVALVKVLK